MGLWEARRGQDVLHEDTGLDWTLEDGQNLNRWSGISLPNIVIQSMGPGVGRQLVGVSVPRLAPPPAAPACREFSFSALEEELWLPFRHRPKRAALGSCPPENIPSAEGGLLGVPLQMASQSPGLLSPALS